MNGIIDALLALGAKNVVLKGVDRQDGIIRNYMASATSGASGKQEIAHDKLPFMTHGTGDAFASALCGAVMAGRLWLNRRISPAIRTPCRGKHAIPAEPH